MASVSPDQRALGLCFLILSHESQHSLLHDVYVLMVKAVKNIPSQAALEVPQSAEEEYQLAFKMNSLQETG